MKSVIHLRTTIVSQFAVVDEDGNTVAIHETDPQWTGALRDDEFIKIMQQNKALREELRKQVNTEDESAAVDAVPPAPVETAVEEPVAEDSPCCGENRSSAP